MATVTQPEEQQQDLVRPLLELTEALLREVHPNMSRRVQVTLDSSIDKDLSFDSLSQVELITRLERRFDVALPSSVYAEAESPRDLLQAIIRARGHERAAPAVQELETPEEEVEDLPRRTETLVDVLAWHVKHHPDRPHLRVLGEEGEQGTLSYAELWQGAERMAAALQQQGIEPGDSVAIMLPSGEDYFYSFFGILLTGAIPVPIYPPARPSQLEDHLRRHTGILNNCLAKLIITMPEAKVVAQLLKSQVQSLRAVVTPSDLEQNSGRYTAPAISPTDIAFLQYTSGSTGNPKGVVLSHTNLLTNIRTMGEAIKAGPNDVFISWLPLYHDMGLIGAWLGSLYFAIPLVVMSPLTFLLRPQRWLEAIHQYRGTLSASPNFGYELCLKRVTDEQMEGLDLSSLRLAFNGAEPISPQTLQRFTERFAPHGFRPSTMLPVFGLAECSLGLAFPPLYKKPVIDCVARESFTYTGHATPAANSDENALCFVGCGQPLAGHEIRIVDADGRELPERQEGRLQFRGPSATSGYYRNPEATAALFDGDWLNSGDLAYSAEGEIFITGRSKDVIIRAGRNIYPHEVEEAVGNLKGVRKGCVVVFGASDRRSGTESLIVVAETREQDTDTQERIYKEVHTIARDLMGLPPDEVLLVPPHTVLKTSSGKIRRAASRALYERGQLAPTNKAVWLQVVHMALHSVVPAWRRVKQHGLSRLYAAYVWSVFGLLSPLVWALVMGLPVMRWRWVVIRGAVRLLAFAARVPLAVHGLEHLPPRDRSAVYVANHASYLDSLVIIATIPRGFSFIGKVELRQRRSVRWFLDRLGVEFVERFDKERGRIDAERLSNVKQRKQDLFFFAEGTFTRVSGLRPFYMGAFITAAQNQIPVVPIAIRGTRSILRAHSWFPRRGRITVSVGKPIDPGTFAEKVKTDPWQSAIKLRDAARKYILRHCGEPELSE